MDMLLEIIGSWVLVIGMIVLFGCNLKRSSGSSANACFAKQEQTRGQAAEQHESAEVELGASGTR